MEKRREIPWPRIFAESIAIVVSILLAFWIQAWWDGRQERSEERELLVTLMEEFEEKKRLYLYTSKYIQGIKDSVNELLDIALNSELDASEEHIDRLIGYTWWFADPEIWRPGALNSLIASGDMGLISNRELRAVLNDWWMEFGKIEQYSIVDRDFGNNRQTPFLARHASLPQILNATKQQPGHPSVTYEHGKEYMIESRVSHSELLANREYQNILAERSSHLTDLLTFALYDFEARADQTMALLRQELNE